MAEGKFTGISAAIKEAQQHPRAGERIEARPPVAAPAGKGRAPGKRSNPHGSNTP
jgi:hypothetical protein